MTFRAAKFLTLFLLLAAIVSPRPPQHAPAPVLLRSVSVGRSSDFAALSEYVKAQELARFYATAASQPIVVETRRRSEGNTGAMRQQEARHRTDAEIEACIIARENGGDYGRSSNPTHFGRYQFSRGTWAANGGDPDTWGHASPEEQDRVFRATVERNGYRDWTPYNGC